MNVWLFWPSFRAGSDPITKMCKTCRLLAESSYMVDAKLIGQCLLYRHQMVSAGLYHDKPGISAMDGGLHDR